MSMIALIRAIKETQKEETVNNEGAEVGVKPEVYVSARIDAVTLV